VLDNPSVVVPDSLAAVPGIPWVAARDILLVAVQDKLLVAALDIQLAVEVASLVGRHMPEAA